MKTSNTARFDELMKLRDEFNSKLQESFEKYESRIKKYNSEKNKKAHKITKYPTSLELSKENHLPTTHKSKKLKKLPPLTPKFMEERGYIYKLPKRSRSIFKEESVTWKPQYMINDYFDMFRRLQDKHEINDWEKVINIYNNLFLNYYS